MEISENFKTFAGDVTTSLDVVDKMIEQSIKASENNDIAEIKE